MTLNTERIVMNENVRKETTRRGELGDIGGIGSFETENTRAFAQFCRNQ